MSYFFISNTGSQLSRLDDCIVIKKDGSVKLFYDGNLRLETTNAGVDITQDLDVDGHTELDNVNVSGIITSAAARVNGATVLNGNVEFYGAVFIF